MEPEPAKRQMAGGCQCGAVRYVLIGPSSGSNICHCRMCQKVGGGPFMAFTGGPVTSLSFTRGEPSYFASSNLVERGFCSTCGTPLTYFLRGRDRVAVTIGSLDSPDDVVPTEQFGVESAVSWVADISALRAFQTAEWLTEATYGEMRSHQYAGDDTSESGRPA
jgi:hypothetical protein